MDNLHHFPCSLSAFSPMASPFIFLRPTFFTTYFVSCILWTISRCFWGKKAVLAQMLPGQSVTWYTIRQTEVPRALCSSWAGQEDRESWWHEEERLVIRFFCRGGQETSDPYRDGTAHKCSPLSSRQTPIVDTQDIRLCLLRLKSFKTAVLEAPPSLN